MHTLLAIVEVPEERRVRCQAAGCGRGVYRRIHVVRDDEQLRVLGSDCYGHLYGAEAERTSVARWGTSARLLTAEERAMLVENTAALIARFEEEARQQESQRKLAEERRVAALVDFGLPPRLRTRLLVVADAMARAKAKCLEEGLNFSDEGSAEEIQRAAIALLEAGR